MGKQVGVARIWGRMESSLSSLRNSAGHSPWSLGDYLNFPVWKGSTVGGKKRRDRLECVG